MTEEINFSYDGGLYAELVRDRTFDRDWRALTHWTLVTRGNSVVKRLARRRRPAPAPRCPQPAS